MNDPVLRPPDDNAFYRRTHRRWQLLVIACSIAITIVQVGLTYRLIVKTNDTLQVSTEVNNRSQSIVNLSESRVHELEKLLVDLLEEHDITRARLTELNDMYLEDKYRYIKPLADSMNKNKKKQRGVVKRPPRNRR